MEHTTAIGAGPYFRLASRQQRVHLAIGHPVARRVPQRVAERREEVSAGIGPDVPYGVDDDERTGQEAREPTRETRPRDAAVAAHDDTVAAGRDVDVRGTLEVVDDLL